MAIRTRHYKNRVTIEENGCILSELPRSRGQLIVWDVMAAAVALLRTPNSGLISGGGMVGALRALGCDQQIAELTCGVRVSTYSKR